MKNRSGSRVGFRRIATPAETLGEFRYLKSVETLGEFRYVKSMPLRPKAMGVEFGAVLHVAITRNFQET